MKDYSRQKCMKYVSHNGEYEHIWFHCPGCGNDHAFTIKAPVGPVWTFNNNYESPTFAPSLLCNGNTEAICHSFVTDGKIYFLGDCFHELKNQTIELPDYEG